MDSRRGQGKRRERDTELPVDIVSVAKRSIPVAERTRVDDKNTSTLCGFVLMQHHEYQGLDEPTILPNGEIAFERKGKWYRAMIQEERRGARKCERCIDTSKRCIFPLQEAHPGSGILGRCRSCVWCIRHKAKCSLNWTDDPPPDAGMGSITAIGPPKKAARTGPTSPSTPPLTVRSRATKSLRPIASQRVTRASKLTRRETETDDVDMNDVESDSATSDAQSDTQEQSQRPAQRQPNKKDLARLRLSESSSSSPVVPAATSSSLGLTVLSPEPVASSTAASSRQTSAVADPSVVLSSVSLGARAGRAGDNSTSRVIWNTAQYKQAQGLAQELVALRLQINSTLQISKVKYEQLMQLANSNMDVRQLVTDLQESGQFGQFPDSLPLSRPGSV